MTSGLAILNAPCSSMRMAPPRSPSGGPSSAGWKTNSTCPASWSRMPASTSATPSRIATCAVVAARVHHADGLAAKLRRGLGLERHVGLLRHRQRVHVGAQSDRASRLRAAQQADDAGHADAGLHFDAERAQALRDLFCRAHFPVAELRMRVEVAPPFDRLRLDGLRGRIELGARDPAAGGLGRARAAAKSQSSSAGVRHQSGMHTRDLREPGR